MRPIEMGLLTLFILLLYGLASRGGEDGGGLYTLTWGFTYGLTAVALFAERRRAKSLFVGALPIVLLVALIVCSASWSDYGDVSLKRAFELVLSTASAYCVVCRFRLEQFLQGLGLAAVSAAALSLIEVVLLPSRGVMRAEYAGAWQGIFVQKNSLGQAMALGAITLIALALKPDLPRARRFVLWASTLLCVLLLAGSQSATSFVMFGLLAATLLLLVVWRSPARGRVVPALIAASTTVILLVALNLESLVDALGRDSTLTGRTDIWPLVTESIGKRPWFGYGYGTFWQPDGTGSAYLPVLLEWAPYHAHNGLLELALDVGLVGVAVFLVILVIAFWRTARTIARGKDVVRLWPLLAVIYFVLGNITEANIAKYNGMNWVIFVVAMLYSSEVPRHRFSELKRDADLTVSSCRSAAPSAVGPYVAPSSRLPRIDSPFG